MAGEKVIKMKEHAIQVNNLTKTFAEVTAVQEISFNIAAGEIFAFLGPNGAGKTTTISMLTTLLRPTSGSAFVAGHDVVKAQDAVRKSIGIVFQEPALDKQLTAYENLELHTVLYRVPRSEQKQRIHYALETVSLMDRAEELIEHFSGGMKRRLEIARALTHTPQVLFLDEPTLGLDPQTRNRIWEILLELREKNNLTIFLTTHYMEEAEFSDRIAIIDGGKIVALDTPSALKSQVGGDIISLNTINLHEDAHVIENQFGLPVTLYQDEIRLEVTDGATFIPRFIREFAGTVQKISLNRPTLDDVFLKLTGHTIRDSRIDGKDLALEDLRAQVQA